MKYFAAGHLLEWKGHVEGTQHDSLPQCYSWRIWSPTTMAMPPAGRCNYTRSNNKCHQSWGLCKNGYGTKEEWWLHPDETILLYSTHDIETIELYKKWQSVCGSEDFEIKKI